ncbi:Uncharacterized protein SCF082_LOCUS46761 [Durusdinium trenchii]|uniref:Uncharacterized protein n=1 Tax=Durusdinium trenchii TaxID=1381693 RepID=A0ABP0RGY3_9DINO
MAAYPTEPTYIMPQGTQVAYGDAMPAYTVDPGAYVSTMQGTPQMMYSSSPYSIPVGASSVQAVPPSVYTTSPYGLSSALDHSQGKWFAPGEALPPGFMVTAHPEGHTAPQETHAMSDLARESFVVTGSGMKTGASIPEGKLAKSSKSKKSKKKKASGCC